MSSYILPLEKIKGLHIFGIYSTPKKAEMWHKV